MSSVQEDLTLLSPVSIAPGTKLSAHLESALTNTPSAPQSTHKTDPVFPAPQDLLPTMATVAPVDQQLPMEYVPMDLQQAEAVT